MITSAEEEYLNNDLNEKRDLNPESVSIMEIGYRKDLKTCAKNNRNLDTEDPLGSEFPRRVFRHSWQVLCDCETLTHTGTDALAKQLCAHWDNLEICLKYEKRFNLNIQKALKRSVEQSSQSPEPKSPVQSTVPELKCFSSDFRLDASEPGPKVQNKYKRLSALRLKQQLFHVLFSQHNMIENPFILDFQLSNWSLTNGFQTFDGMSIWPPFACNFVSNQPFYMSTSFILILREQSSL